MEVSRVHLVDFCAFEAAQTRAVPASSVDTHPSAPVLTTKVPRTEPEFDGGIDFGDVCPD